jgi:hypothetical protein
MITKTSRVLAASALLVKSWAAGAGKNSNDHDCRNRHYSHHRVVVNHPVDAMLGSRN